MEKVIVKLTDNNNKTYRGMEWGPGISHHVNYNGKLCTNGVIHAYEGETEEEALALAILMNPIHVNFSQPLAWLCKSKGQSVTDGTKSGFEWLQTIREIPMPKISIEKRVEIAIVLASKVCKDKKFLKWADNWLKNVDRSYAAANAAYAANAAADAAAYAAANAAAYAADAAAYAAADAAAYAACAAAYAAKNQPLDLKLIASIMFRKD